MHKSRIEAFSAWLGENHFASVPAALYGAILFMSSIAYLILQQTILASPGGKTLAKAIGRDARGKSSTLIYAAAIALSFPFPLLACALYVLVALLWLIPDRRIEKLLVENQ